MFWAQMVLLLARETLQNAILILLMVPGKPIAFFQNQSDSRKCLGVTRKKFSDNAKESN